jgi:hypothetical protein
MVFLIVGIVITAKYKFYKYDTSDMIFATKFRVFLAALLLTAVSAYGLVKILFD